MAKIYKTTGEVIEVSPKNGKTFELEELQAIVEHKVDGVSCHYIEIINLLDGRLMVFERGGQADWRTDEQQGYRHFRAVLWCVRHRGRQRACVQ